MWPMAALRGSWMDASTSLLLAPKTWPFCAAKNYTNKRPPYLISNGLKLLSTSILTPWFRLSLRPLRMRVRGRGHGQT